MPRENRFTIYDMLEKKGYFDINPANSYARSPTDGASLYKGPVEYPKMLYHPLGEERQTVAPELLSTPLGPKEVGEQRELVWKIVENAAQDKEAVAEGWHTHPAKAIRARVEALIASLSDQDKLDEKTRVRLLASIPTMSSDQRIKDLEAELARLTLVHSAESAQRAEDQEA